MELLVGFALVASLVAVRHFAARHIARGQGRFAWIYFAPTLLAMVCVIWIAVRMWAIQPLAAIALGLIGVPSLFLFVRVVRRMASDAGAPDMIGNLSPPLFDYIVWMAIGIPFVLVAGLLLLLVTGGLGNSP